MMMGKYSNFEKYLQELSKDIYPQPPDENHVRWAIESIEWLVGNLEFKTVLDVGCGEAFVQEYFEKYGKEYTGITLGEIDYKNAREKNRNVILGDFNFLPCDNNSYDVIYSRHSLEHSPMPLISLMEWHRVARVGLCVVLPRPNYWGFAGRNHYSVMVPTQAKFLLGRAGWRILKQDFSSGYELRYICQKVEEYICE